MTFKPAAHEARIAARAEELYRESRVNIHRQADQVIGWLLLAQWFACIAIAAWLSPYTWIGDTARVHQHVYAAIFLGGIIMLPAWALSRLRAGRPSTCYFIAVAQMLASALLIHLTGGRIESHFHVFGSLAFLAYYREWRVIVVASAVVAIDHYLRGVYWPQSVFGVVAASHWRWLEHAWWVVFEDIFLIIGGVRSLRIFRQVARTRAELEAAHDAVEEIVVERTAQLETANKSLHAELATRTKIESDLKSAKEAADAASQAKTQFLANMSHEVRTPLNGMLGMSCLLLDTRLDEQQRMLAETFRQCTESLTGVVDDILDFSNLENATIAVASEPFSLRAAVTEALALHMRSASAKGLILTHAIADELPDRFVGDGARIRQVISNLVSNGVKFTAHGRVVVTVEMGPASPDPATITIHFQVQDTGIGIPVDRVPHIFHAFEQLDNSMTRRFGGTGLGLAIVQRLVDLMRGRVSVSSMPGRGSTFDVSLPLTVAPGEACPVSVRRTPLNRLRAETPATPARPSSPPPSTLPRTLADEVPLRILIAEDNDVNRMVARRFLALYGYACDEAGDGAEAVAACARTKYDLVFMDIQMPVMDGYDATREIIAQQREQRPQIVALTAHATDADRRACLECGMDDFMTKPIEPEVLEAKLRSTGARIAATRQTGRHVPSTA